MAGTAVCNAGAGRRVASASFCSTLFRARAVWQGGASYRCKSIGAGFNGANQPAGAARSSPARPGAARSSPELAAVRSLVLVAGLGWAVLGRAGRWAMVVLRALLSALLHVPWLR